MLNIILENLNQSNHVKLYVAKKERLATATSASFVNKNYLVVTNLVAMKMYLYFVDYSKKEYYVVDKIDTIHNKKLTLTDLLDFNGTDLLITSNCNNGTQTIYQIKNNKLAYVKDINTLESRDSFCHGVRFYPKHKDIICATIFKGSSVNFIDIKSNKLIYKIVYPNKKYRPKDLTFNGDNIIVLYTDSDAKSKPTDKIYKSLLVYYHVELINKKHHIIVTHSIDKSHGDSILLHNNLIYVNKQLTDKINVFKLNNNTIKHKKDILGFNMPHGMCIDSENNLLAVTNYGDNTVKIIKLDD